MSRLFALDEAKGRTVLRGFDLIWSVIRTLGADGRLFSAPDIDGQIHDSLRSVRDYLRRLEAAGIVEPTGWRGDGRYRQRIYRLLQRPTATPCLKRGGAAGVQGRGQAQMWTAMRALRDFDVAELAASASTDEATVAFSTAKRFAVALATAGYLQAVQPARPARGGQRARWRLKPRMNTGPHAPAILRTRAVFDLNLGRTVGETLGEEVSP